MYYLVLSYQSKWVTVHKIKSEDCSWLRFLKLTNFLNITALVIACIFVFLRHFSSAILAWDALFDGFTYHSFCSCIFSLLCPPHASSARCHLGVQFDACCRRHFRYWHFMCLRVLILLWHCMPSSQLLFDVACEIFFVRKCGWFVNNVVLLFSKWAEMCNLILQYICKGYIFWQDGLPSSDTLEGVV